MRPWSVTNCRSRLTFLYSKASTVKSILGLGRGVRFSMDADLPPRPLLASRFSVWVLRGIRVLYLISRWRVRRRRAGLYFLISCFSVVVFLFRVVVWREGDVAS